MSNCTITLQVSAKMVMLMVEDANKDMVCAGSAMFASNSSQPSKNVVASLVWPNGSSARETFGHMRDGIAWLAGAGSGL